MGNRLADLRQMEQSFDDLLKKIQQGEESAFVQIYQRYCSRLDKFIYFRAGRDYEDISSEVWIGVTLRLHEFQGSEAQFQAWLYRIARNRIADYFRKNKITSVNIADMDDAVDKNYVINSDNDLLLISDEESVELNKYLKSNLKSHEYEIVYLRVIAGCSVKEVAEMTQTNEAKVRLIQHRALKKLSRTVVINTLNDE